MNATCEVTIEIDGKKTEVALGMRDGVRNMHVCVMEKACAAVTDFQHILVEGLKVDDNRDAQNTKNVQLWTFLGRFWS